MKKFSLSLIFLAIASVAIVMFACKKESEPQTNNSNPSQVVGQQNNDAVGRIVKFKKQLAYYKANPDIKDGETISLEDAVWNIENAFDATYAFPEDAYTETRTQNFTLHLNVGDDGNVFLSDLTLFFEQMVNAARSLYANDGFTDKIFISLMAKVLETKNDGVDVKITMITGERTNVNNNPPDARCYGPFREGDDWKYAFGMGKCDTLVYGGADFQLQEHLKSLLRSSLEEPQVGCRNIYVNRQQIVFDGRGVPSIFYRTDTADVCIPWIYMNDCYQAEKRAIWGIIPEIHSISGEPIGIFISGESGRSNETEYITHRNVIDYAERIEANIGDVGEAEDLLEN